MKNKILFVEDETDLRLIVLDVLKEEGYEVIEASDGIECLNLLKTETPDLIIADVMMPKMDGFTMAKEIRKVSMTIPIIFLTAKSSIDDLETGFATGANDYLRKPFELRELIVRIKALLRQYGFKNEEFLKFNIGKFIFNIKEQTLSLEEETIDLSHFETKILEYLASNMGKTVDASELMRAIWHRDEISNRNSLHGYIHKLRGYLKKDPKINIINQRGFGYMLVIKE